MLIERLFSRFSAMYGAAFGRQWDGADLQEVKATWAEKLGGFTAEQIGAGLNLCDDRQYPPNLPEFIAMCRTRAVQEARRIEPPAISREDAEKAIQKAAERLPKQDGRSDMKHWAKKLRERYLAGECLMLLQIESASAALNETWDDRVCKPIMEAA